MLEDLAEALEAEQLWVTRAVRQLIAVTRANLLGDVLLSDALSVDPNFSQRG